MGIILRHPWEFSETSIWGLKLNTRVPIMLGDDPIWSVECSHGREKAGGVGLRALIKAFFLILATVAVLEVGHADFSANLLPCVSEKATLSSNVAWEPYRAGEGRWTFMGIILRHPWEFFETSIWGLKLYTKWPIMLGNDPTWSVECSHGREKAGGPGLWALIKAFSLILATVAVLEVGHAEFSANLLPCVSEKATLSSNVAWEPYRAGEGRWTFMGIILRHPWECSETSIWGLKLNTRWPIMLGDDPIWSVECSHGREKAGGVGLRALIKAFFLILATVAVLEVGHADFSANLLPCVSEKATLSSNVAWEPYRAGEGRWTFMGIILRHPWEFSETSIWGLKLYTKWPIMLGNDPTWSVECSHGREKAGGPGLWALIKAFSLILATVAVLEVGHADFSANLLPCVSEKATLSSNVAWEPYRAGKGRWTFMGIILRHPWEFSETSIWGLKLYTKWPIMLGNDPTWSVECSHGREKAGGPGLRALIKAFFLILATVAVLEVGHEDFSANLLPCVSEKATLSSNVAWEPYRAGRWTFMGIILRHPWEFSETSIWGLKIPMATDPGPICLCARKIALTQYPRDSGRYCSCFYNSVSQR